METIGIIGIIIGIILGLYRDNGKENGNYPTRLYKLATALAAPLG